MVLLYRVKILWNQKFLVSGTMATVTFSQCLEQIPIKIELLNEGILSGDMGNIPDVLNSTDLRVTS